MQAFGEGVSVNLFVYVYFGKLCELRCPKLIYYGNVPKFVYYGTIYSNPYAGLYARFTTIRILYCITVSVLRIVLSRIVLCAPGPAFGKSR